MAVVVDEEHGRVRLGCAAGHGHGLGRRSGLVEQRRVCQRQPGEVGHQCLVVEQCLQAPLRDLRLVRRVRRVPGGVLEHVALDDRRGDGVAVALPDERRHHHVLCCHFAQACERRTLGDRARQIERGVKQDRCRHGLADEGVERRGPDGLQHHVLLGRHGADVAGDELVGALEFGEALMLWHAWRLPRAVCESAPPLSVCLRDAPAVRAFPIGGVSSTLSPALPRPPRSWCLRDSGAVAPSAPARSWLSHSGRSVSLP